MILPEETATFPHLEAFTAEIYSALDKFSVHVPNAECNRASHVNINYFTIFTFLKLAKFKDHLHAIWPIVQLASE